MWEGEVTNLWEEGEGGGEDVGRRELHQEVVHPRKLKEFCLLFFVVHLGELRGFCLLCFVVYPGELPVTRVFFLFNLCLLFTLCWQTETHL